MKSSLRSVDRHGLTLLELVVVLAVLAALASVIVPKLDFVKSQADHATAAANSADLTTMLQTHKTSTGQYPTLDSLIDSGGAVITRLWKASGSDLPFEATTIPAAGGPGSSWYLSFLEGGLTTAYAQNNTGNASDSAVVASVKNLSDLAAAGTLVVAELNYDAGPGSQPYVASIVSRIFPGQTAPPAGVRLIGLGIGPANTMVGNVMTNTPLETQGDDPARVYCRHIAIFAIYGSGKPAQLKMVVDHRMKQIDKRVDQFNKTGPTGI